MEKPLRKPQSRPSDLDVASRHVAMLPPAVRSTVQAARRMVKSVAPEAREVAYLSQPPASSRTLWKLVRYALEDAASVVGIGTYPDHVCLYCYRGRELDDGAGLLQGGGEVMRYATLRAPADVRKDALRRLVQKAFELATAQAVPSARERPRR